MGKGATCRKCGLSSVLTDHFWRRLCPTCQPKRLSTGPGLLLVGFGIGVVAVLVFTASRTGARFDGFAWALLAALMLAPVRGLIHEAGHALAARLHGWSVPEVRVGRGAEWFAVRTGDTRWSFGRGLLTDAGWCTAIPTTGTVTRWSCASFFLMPSLLQGTVVAGLVSAFDFGSFGGKLAVLFSFFMVVDIFRNLSPHDHAGPDGRVASDGKHLARLLRDAEAELAVWHAQAAAHAARCDLEADRMPEALDALERAVARFPDDRHLRGMLAACYHLCGRTEEALRRVEDYAAVLAENGGFAGDEAVAYLRASLLVGLDRLDEVVALSEKARDAATSEEARARWSACLALALLLRRQDDESVTRAAAEAEYAFARLPWVDYVVTAQGMVLIENGKHDDGLRLFRIRDRREPDRSGMQDAWRIVAHAALGNRNAATEAMERLRATRSWPACLRRAEAALGRGADAEP